MKIALITDIHFGARNDNKKIADFQEKFFNEVFIPYLDNNNITTVIDLGDTFDRRKYINFVSLDRSKKMFFDPLAERNIALHALVGNHDAFYKNTLEVNSMDLLTSCYANVNVIKQPQVVNFDGLDILMIPWICANNEKEIFDLCAQTTSQVVFGHLELSGYQMYRGQSIYHGMDDKWLKKFDIVCTGHYHTKSTTGNINYLGCPYEMTWSDYDDQKGFHIFDTDTRELTFIPNPFNMFYKIHYNDVEMVVTDVINLDMSIYRDRIIKVIIKNKTNPYWFDMFIEKLEKAEPLHVQVVEDHLNLNLDNDKEIIQEAQDTLTILNNYIQQLETVGDKNAVSNIMRELYAEALSIE